ncbi:hypothetical protein BEI_0690 [Halomonas beimenensis]|uniref:Uncharacterized protein n=1 Tax=Halomonas beimenensis TaxID=475662 RepID=A0A291P464_9GAMM|nr:hypothetical protein BEI_0690 [Halomonas beimenensis]
MLVNNVEKNIADFRIMSAKRLKRVSLNIWKSVGYEGLWDSVTWQ